MNHANNSQNVTNKKKMHPNICGVTIKWAQLDIDIHVMTGMLIPTRAFAINDHAIYTSKTVRSLSMCFVPINSTKHHIPGDGYRKPYPTLHLAQLFW